MAEIEAKITLNVPDEMIENILVGCFEGGSNYWIRYVEATHKPKGIATAIWCAQQINSGNSIVIKPDEDGDDKISITKDDLLNGILLWCKNFSERIEVEKVNGKLQLDRTNSDASDDDIILQYASFGKVVYG